MSDSIGSVTAAALRDGDRESLERLVPALYQQLRSMAQRRLGYRPRGGTLETGDLVHEAYLKVVSGSRGSTPDGDHFLALASLAMRHVLVDRAKARLAQKREGGLRRVTLDEEQLDADDQAELMVDLNDAIDKLAVTEPRLARVVECRFFGGLSEEETAEVLEVTARTVQRDWAKARMLLRRALSP